MAYYDHICRKWHKVTGYRGGPLKRIILNELLLRKISEISIRSTLELGAGNGYFMRMVVQRFSGQMPYRIVITDQSPALLGIAERNFAVPGAEYLVLDVKGRFPFEDGAFNFILATLVFNEVSTGGLRRALAECRRVLSDSGTLLISVTHPSFVESLSRRGLLVRDSAGCCTMPTTGGLRVPVFERSKQEYERLLGRAGLAFGSEDVHATRELLNAMPGLKSAGDVPLVRVFTCRKRESR